MNKNKKPQQSQSDHPSSEPDLETTALCAYSIWEQEDRPNGKHEIHWHQAVAQLRKTGAAKK